MAQADVAVEAKEKAVGEMVEEISKSPTGPALVATNQSPCRTVGAGIAATASARACSRRRSRARRDKLWRTGPEVSERESLCADQAGRHGPPPSTEDRNPIGWPTLRGKGSILESFEDRLRDNLARPKVEIGVLEHRLSILFLNSGHHVALHTWLDPRLAGTGRAAYPRRRSLAEVVSVPRVRDPRARGLSVLAGREHNQAERGARERSGPSHACHFSRFSEKLGEPSLR